MAAQAPASSSEDGVRQPVYPQRPPREHDDTDHLFWEGVVPEPDPEDERIAKLTSATPGVDEWKRLLCGSGEEDEHYYLSEDEGR